MNVAPTPPPLAIRKRLYVLLGVAVCVFLTLLLSGPISQDPNYHNFADQRTLWGLNHFWNVVTNLPFLIISIWGLYWQFNKETFGKTFTGKLILATLFTGLALTCFGSGWYHYRPSNFTLMWDRLPMTLVFMSFFALIIMDFIGRKLGEISFYGFLALGLFSVPWWYYTELGGAGDLRLYVFVQFFPMISIPLILLLFRRRTGYGKHIWWIFFFYILAKAFEMSDHVIFNMNTQFSGHSLKHLFAGIACFFIVRLLQVRQINITRIIETT